MRHGLTNSGSCLDTNQTHKGSVIKDDTVLLYSKFNLQRNFLPGTEIDTASYNVNFESGASSVN